MDFPIKPDTDIAELDAMAQAYVRGFQAALDKSVPGSKGTCCHRQGSGERMIPTSDDLRAWCPYCDEPVRRAPPDVVEYCPEHGVLEALSTADWQAIERERGVRP